MTALTLLALPVLGYAFFKNTPLFAPEAVDEPAAASSRREAPAPARSCDDLRVIVDKKNPLPSHYAPRDLVSLRPRGIPTQIGNLRLREEAALHLSDLAREARESGIELMVASAYRSYDDQRATFVRYSYIYGDRAEAITARPGHSQHQLGTAVDFTTSAVGYDLVPSFRGTEAGRWLMAHAPEHGFVVAYPNGTEKKTGIQWEPWHYRYIGVENARRLQKSDLNLHAFLEGQNVRPRC